MHFSRRLPLGMTSMLLCSIFTTRQLFASSHSSYSWFSCYFSFPILVIQPVILFFFLFCFHCYQYPHSNSNSSFFLLILSFLLLFSRYLGKAIGRWILDASSSFSLPCVVFVRSKVHWPLWLVAPGWCSTVREPISQTNSPLPLDTGRRLNRKKR